MKYCFIVILSLGLGACRSSADQANSNSSPNVIFIMADDLGYGDLGCYGQQRINTPNIDRLAAEGMRFTQHYAGSPICAPSRCVLMTGKHTGQAYVRFNRQVKPFGQLPLPEAEITVAELLKTKGYVNGMVGKWGLGTENTSGDPLRQGFDLFYGYLDQVEAHNYYPEYLWRNHKKEYLGNEVQYMDSTAWHGGAASITTKKVNYSHDFFTTEALDFIDTHQDTSFFLYLPYTIPHASGAGPGGELMEVPDVGEYADENWPKSSKAYASMVSRLDQDVGRIVEKVKALGIQNNTLIIFTSDNGPMSESIEGITKLLNSNGDLRGGKRDMYEGGIRVPFIASWPGHIKAGAVSDQITSFWDFLPTLCDLVDIKIPSEVSGISYLPSLVSKPQPEPDYLYWEFPAPDGYQVAVREGNWKGIKSYAKENASAHWKLYDLSEDIGETKNMADQQPEIVLRMNEIIRESHTHSSLFPMPFENN